MINILLNANGKVKEIDEFYRQKNLLVLNYMNSKKLSAIFWDPFYVMDEDWKADG